MQEKIRRRSGEAGSDASRRISFGWRWPIYEISCSAILACATDRARRERRRDCGRRSGSGPRRQPPKCRFLRSARRGRRGHGGAPASNVLRSLLSSGSSSYARPDCPLTRSWGPTGAKMGRKKAAFWDLSRCFAGVRFEAARAAKHRKNKVKRSLPAACLLARMAPGSEAFLQQFLTRCGQNSRGSGMAPLFQLTKPTERSP